MANGEVVSDCFEGKQYVLFSVSAFFSEAVDLCKNVADDLLTIKSVDTFNFVNSFLNETQANPAWIGLTRPPGSDPNDPASFSFQDGSPLEADFGSARGVLPWAENNPSASAAECVSIETNGLWDTRNCLNIAQPLCERTCPTVSSCF